MPVKSITLFIFGGVSQIGSEARRPLHEFIMAIVGPLTSLLLGGLFFGVWWLIGDSDAPLTIVLEWLFIMNLILAAFNMAPGFPLDGGRVLRSLLWGVSGNLYKATRLATFVGRCLGYGLILIGGAAFFGILRFMDPVSGVWFGLLGLFLESSARQSWFQAKALDILSQYRADGLMRPDLAIAAPDERAEYLRNRAGNRHFIFFVSDDDDRVVGVLTEKEMESPQAGAELSATAAEIMVPQSSIPVAASAENGADLLQRMEAETVWHLPVLSDGRVIGVVSKEDLLRLLARDMVANPRLV
jgi:CBS domain-containing protein